MKIGFTGTQGGMTSAQQETLRYALREPDLEEFHHGDCIGADAEAHDIARSVKLPKIIVHPPLINTKRAFRGFKTEDMGWVFIRPQKDYLDRNRDIVDVTDRLIATPSSDSEVVRSGTWATIRYARQVGKPIWIILPNGEIRYE